MTLRELRNDLWKAATPEAKEDAIFALVDNLVEVVGHLESEVMKMRAAK